MGVPVHQASRVERRRRVHAVTFSREYAARQRPVVLEGCADHWKAFPRWSDSYLRARFGDVPLALEHGVLTLGDLFEEIDEGAAPYVWDHPVRGIAAELEADISPAVDYARNDWIEAHPFPRWFCEPVHRVPEIEIGGAGSLGPVRRAPLATHTFVTQVIGARRLLLLAPEARDHLYLEPAVPHLSPVFDLARADARRFPDIDRLEPQVAELEAGDTLFVPAGWWHESEVVSPYSVSVSVGVVNRSNYPAFVASLGAPRTPSALVCALALRLYGWWRGRREEARAELLASVR